MATLIQDLRYAIRTLLRQPVFALIAILTLALGIGANTAIFSLVDAVLLRPLPFPQADRLVSVWSYDRERGRKEPFPISYPKYEMVRDQQTVFADLGVAAYDGFTLTGRGAPAQIQGAYVSARSFPTLGIVPILGRLFLPQEDAPKGPQVVIVSASFWRKYGGSDPALLGQSLILNSIPYTVVGIVPDQLTYPFVDCGLFVPGVLNTPDYAPIVIQHGGAYLCLTARLKPGVSLERADEEMGLLAGRYRQAFPNQVDARAELLAKPLHEEVVGYTRPMFYTLAGAVGFVLLIACVNVANLLLARLAGRRKEIAIRAALGASRWRLGRQFMTESLLLTLVAGAIGSLLALWCVDLARTLGPEVIPRAAEIHLSGTVLLFTLGISLGAGLLLGVAPALHAARGNPGEALQQTEARGSSGGVRQGRTRAALLIVQVALSLVLLTGTGLLLTSLWQLQRVRLGYNPDGLLVADVTLPVARYPKSEQQANFFARVVKRIDALPGVRCAGVSSSGPLVGGLEIFYAVIGQPLPPIQQRAHARYACISPDYLKTIGTPIVQGRPFTERDRTGAPQVVIINQTMARKLFPGSNALGRRLLCTASDPTPAEIVGVMADARTVGLALPPVPEIYFSMFQREEIFMNVYVQAIIPGQAAGLESAVRAAVHAVDSDQPIGEVHEMNFYVNRSVADRHLMAMLLASFAGLALVLAAIGIYGVTAYGVAQRTREIGIRMALGAQRSDVFRLIIGGGMKLILAGMVLGVVTALGLTRLLASLLYGVGATDPLIFAVVIGLLTLVALLANYLPARWATQVDPLTALREE